MYFDNFTIFKNKSNNVILKKKLINSQKNLKIVIDVSIMFCDRHRRQYVQNLNNVKQRLNYKFRATIYRDFQIYVIFFVLKKFDDHYKRLTKIENKNIKLSICTKIFKRIMKLSCAHVIKKRRVNAINDEMLRLTNVHFH